MAKIALVTDTSSDLLPQQAEQAGVRLVPLTVSFGDETFEAGTELSNEAFYQRLTAPGAPFPRTAAPNPGRFEAAYREAFEEGADGVVCVTISSKLSATYQAATKGAEAFDPGAVQVLDSLTTTHALAMMVLRAAQKARGGATQAEIVADIRDVALRSDLYFTLDTLEYLQKGGRIGRASALLGSVLSIKPILRVEDGVVEAADRRRTAAKAKARLIELISARPIEQAVVVHTMTDGIEAIRDEVAVATGLGPDSIGIGLTGPVAGTHVGPGMYGVALIQTA